MQVPDHIHGHVQDHVHDHVELSTSVLKTLEVCDRLSKWSQQPTQSRTIRLAQACVATLAAQARTFGEEITCSPLSTSSLPREIPTERYHHHLSRIRELLFEATNILDFCKSNELDGQDDEMNATYASFFIIENKLEVEAQLNQWYNRAKILRAQQEFADIIGRRFGPNAASVNYRWGAEPGARPPSLDGLEYAGQ